jgi:hypothetical protein
MLTGIVVPALEVSSTLSKPALKPPVKLRAIELTSTTNTRAHKRFSFFFIM